MSRNSGVRLQQRAGRRGRTHLTSPVAPYEEEDTCDKLDCVQYVLQNPPDTTSVTSSRVRRVAPPGVQLCERESSVCEVTKPLGD